jgi:acyl-CoA synthetase (AMP-forming)/AMP-acid ligase II
MANNLADKFEAMADAAPQRIALIEGERQVTFAELESQANRLAHHLAAVGVVTGDRVGLVARNSVGFVLAFIATFKLRAVPVNVNYRYVAAELAELFEDSGSVALVVDEDLVGECARAIASAAVPHHVVVIGEMVGALEDRATTFADALDSSSPRRDFEPRSGDDLHFIYTGGTRGRPQTGGSAPCRSFHPLIVAVGTDCRAAHRADHRDPRQVRRRFGLEPLQAS